VAKVLSESVTLLGIVFRTSMKWFDRVKRAIYIKEVDMINKYMLQLVITLAILTFLLGCGRGDRNTPLTSPGGLQIWSGTWTSSKVIASGTMSLTVSESDTSFSSGSITMSGSPCFSTSPITGWTVSGITVSWSAPEIGNFSGTITGGEISGTYSVTKAGACSGDTGIFSIID